MQIDTEREHSKRMSDTFSYGWRGVGIYLQVVTEGSRGLGRRVKRKAEGSRIDFKNLCESCSRRSAKLGMAAVQHNTER